MAVFTITEVNTMDCERFIETFGNIIEHCQLGSAAVWASRPFDSLHGLHTSFCNFLDGLPVNGKIVIMEITGREGVLRLHPDLAGKIAEQGGLSTESEKEQSAAGLKELSEEDKSALQYLNERYKGKFGFPFVICAKENKVQAIIKGITARFGNDKSVELTTGIEEVKKIVFHRLCDIIQTD